MNIPGPVFDQIARAIARRETPCVDGYRMTAQASYRGETRVWAVSGADDRPLWFVKRLDDPQIYRRYVTGMRLVAEIADGTEKLTAMRCANADEETLVIATSAVSGELASQRLIDSSRFDRLPSWRAADLAGLGAAVGEALRAVWSYEPSALSELDCYQPVATADRIGRKLQRLTAISVLREKDYRQRIEAACSLLRNVSCRDSLLIGDVDLVNMLIAAGRVCFFDLDDIGYGDRQRDLACLLHRLQIVRRNWKYASRRIDALLRNILGSLDFRPDERLIAAYQVELQLDALWSASQSHADKTLPVHGQSVDRLQADLDRLLDRALQ